MVSQEQIDMGIGSFVPGGRYELNEVLPNDFILQGSKHKFICFSGDGTRNAGDGNAMAHWVKNWLRQSQIDGDIYGTYYKASSDSLKNARADLNASMGQGIGKPDYKSKYTDFFDANFKCLLYDDKGMLHPIDTIAKNLRNTTLVGWCHGSTVTYELEHYLIEHLQKNGIEPVVVDKVMKNLSVLNFAPREPVGLSKARVLEVLSLSDSNYERSFKSDIIYNEGRLAQAEKRCLSDIGGNSSSAVTINGKKVVPIIATDGNKTLLMPISLQGEGKGEIEIGFVASLEHNTVNILLDSKTKSGSEAKQVVQNFLQTVVDPSREIEINTSKLGNEWEVRTNLEHMEQQKTHLLDIHMEYETFCKKMEEKYGELWDQNVGKTLSSEEYIQYQAVSKKLEQRQKIVESSQTLPSSDTPKLKNKETSSKKNSDTPSSTTAGRQIRNAALHIGGRVGAMYAAGYVGEKYKAWQNEREHSGGMIALEEAQKSLALKRADQMLAVGGITVMGAGLAVGIGEAVGSKVLQKGAGKVAAKSIPFIGTGLGCLYAVRRSFDGDWTGVGMELTSAALDVVSGLGVAASTTGVGAFAGVPLATWATGASFAIDTTLALRDGMRQADGMNFFALNDEQGNPIMQKGADGQEYQAVGAAVEYKNNRKNGTATWYDKASDGTIKPVVFGQYKNDKKDGEWIVLDENSHIREVSHYKNGVLDGVYRRFDEKGNLLIEGEFPNGSYEEYWTDENGLSTGIVRKSGHFKDGKQVGDWYILNENGQEFRVNVQDKSIKTKGSDNKEYVTYADGRTCRWNSETMEIEDGYLDDKGKFVWNKRTELVDSVAWNRAHGRDDFHYPRIGDPDYMSVMGDGLSYRNVPPMAVAPEIRRQSQNTGIKVDNGKETRKESERTAITGEIHQERTRFNDDKKKGKDFQTSGEISTTQKTSGQVESEKVTQEPKVRKVQNQSEAQKKVSEPKLKAAEGTTHENLPVEEVKIEAKVPQEIKGPSTLSATKGGDKTVVTQDGRVWQEQRNGQFSEVGYAVSTKGGHIHIQYHGDYVPPSQKPADVQVQTDHGYMAVGTLSEGSVSEGNDTGSYRSTSGWAAGEKTKNSQGEKTKTSQNSVPEKTQKGENTSVTQEPGKTKTGTDQKQSKIPPRAQHESGSRKTGDKQSTVGKVDPRKGKTAQYGNGKGIDDAIGKLQAQQKAVTRTTFEKGKKRI